MPLRREPEQAGPRPPSAPRRAQGAPAAAADLPAEAAPVFERLRAWRAATAKEQGVPAYVIFHDATLREIATVGPRRWPSWAGSAASARTSWRSTGRACWRCSLRWAAAPGPGRRARPHGRRQRRYAGRGDRSEGPDDWPEMEMEPEPEDWM